MFARVSTIQGKPDRINEVIRLLKEAAPKGLEAMKGSYLLVDRKSGKIRTITLWETEKALQASSAAADKVRGQMAEVMAASSKPVVEIFEVALEE